MDPISAFGLAASIAQFIDFTESLLSGTYYIYKSATATGDTKINFDLMTVTTSLKTLNEDLQSSFNRGGSEDRILSKYEQEISKICKDCGELADELISSLETLRVQNRDDIWESFRKALRTIWSNRQIESLEKRLSAFRMQLMLQINASLLPKLDLLQTTQLRQGHLISSSLQIAREARQNSLKHKDQTSLWQQKVIEDISSSVNAEPQSTRTVWNRNDLLLNPDGEGYRDFTKRFYHHILRHLKFNDMYLRANGVSYPYSQTYNWLYSNRSGASSSNFVNFLESNHNLFWITGKPASGKSTLMKMINDDARTQYHLKVWASGESLLVSRFYFWCSGTEIQMSQEGLLRTLLYEALETLPHLAHTIFPHRMENFVVFGNGIGCDAPWDVPELMQAYKQLVLEATKSKKIFLLIDGLDEFRSGHLEQAKLMEFLHSLLSLSPKVKACVSSRPWNIFADAFHTRPSLRVEDLTLPDIQHYVSSNLSENLGFTALKRGNPELASTLVNNISTKASGVFLWVVLVVRSLLQGLTDGERLSDLQKRLDSLPPDIEPLVWSILKSVDFRRISQLIRLAELSFKSDGQALTAIQLFYADEDDIEFVFQLQIPVNDTRHALLSSNSEMIRRRLNACSKGLLEFQKADSEILADATVQYLHRTVRDFIQRSEMWNQILEATTESFCPELSLAVSSLACFKMGYVKAIPAGMADAKVFWDSLITSMVTIYRHSPRTSLLLILDELERVAELKMVSTCPDNPMTYETCTLNSGSEYVPILSFLHLAVKLQLVGYVKQKASHLYETGKIDLLQPLFQMAVTEYRTNHNLLHIKNPNLLMIEHFLELKLNPSQRLRTSKGEELRTKNTIWQYIIAEFGQRPPILELFLRYGADPFVLGLEYVNGNNFQKFLQEAKKKARKKGTKKESTSKTESFLSLVTRNRPTGKRGEQNMWND